jgi:hypothetical protein
LVSINSSPPEILDLRLRRELVEPSELLEFSTPIGLPKTEPTNILRLFLLTHLTMVSETIPESTGLLNPTKNTESSVEPPPLESQAEVSELKVILIPRPDLLAEPTTREETASSSEDTDDLYLNKHLFLPNHQYF